MPVKEIETFRKKYPQYNDLSDSDLAGKLAAKYPEAYGDLPAKVGQQGSVGKAIAGSVAGQAAVGTGIVEKFKSAKAPTPTFQGLPKEGDVIPEGKEIGGSPFMATPDVPVPRAVKQMAVQLPAAAVGGPMAAAGAEFARQKFSGEETSLGDVGLALLTPGMGQTAGAGLKMTGRTAAGMTVPGLTRKAGFEVVERQFGRKTPSRFLGTKFDTPHSSIRFKQAAKVGPIPTDKARQGVAKALAKESGMSTPNRAAITRLKNLENKLASSPTIDAGDFIDEIQRIRQLASKNLKGGVGADPTLGTTLENTAKDLIDSAPPQYKEALQLWKRESSLSELVDELTKSNSSVSFFRTVRNDPIIKGAFTKTELAEIEQIAEAISRISTGVNVGFGNRMMLLISEPMAFLLNSRVGRGLLRTLMKDPDMTAGKFAAAVGQIAGISGLDAARSMGSKE